jgi:tetratricopeptide (TPR) repeat protein
MSSTQSAPPPDPALVTSTIGRLRAEHASSGDSGRQAILLHEIGVLEERLGDEAAAARDQLSAVNAEPEFSEPLERLIAIIERRQSFKNLGKLLDRLSKIAQKPEERARAAVEQAAFLSDHEQDHASARALLEQAAEETPGDASIWLMLELCAAKLGDPELREQALERRASIAGVPEWRALLLADLAELRFDRGEHTGAFAALDEAVELRTRASFAVLVLTEQLAHKSEHPEHEARALEAQAAMIVESLSDPLRGDELGIPHSRRNAPSAADVWLRASDAHRRRGDVGAATALLDRALEQLPGDPLLSHARLAAAEVSGDIATMAKLARAELEAGAEGEVGAALWLRVAESAAAEGDGAGALKAVGKALENDPSSVPAQALELDLLASTGNGQGLAGALEATAERLATDRAKADYFLLAADVWAREARDTQGARAALSQAGMFGAPPGTVARVARLLAGLVSDGTWYEEASRRLLAQGALPEEQVSLWFELLRARALRIDRAGAEAAARNLAANPSSGWLGNLLSAYVLELVPRDGPSLERKSSPPPEPERGGGPLHALARLERDPARARAFKVLAVVRALMSAEFESAEAELAELHAEEPGDAVCALALASLEQQRGKPDRAIAILTACAGACDDPELQASLYLTSGILSFRAGNRREAVEHFERGADSAPKAGGTLLAWALRAAEPDQPDARRRALESADGAENPLFELERFGIELGRSGSRTAAIAALEAVGESAPEELLAAADLARAAFVLTTPEERRQALLRLGGRGPVASALSRAAELDLVLEQANGAQPDAEAAEEAARGWAHADPSLAPAIEWLGAALAKADIHAEVEARRAIAARLTGPAQAALAASASLVAELGATDQAAPVELDDPAAALANLELALPGTDPRRRAAALVGVSASLGEDSLGSLLAMTGYNQLAFGDAESALATFRTAVELLPDEIIGWEGLRAAAERLGDKTSLAEACAALGDATLDPQKGAEFWERASGILLDELNDPERGEFALSRAVDRDIARFAPFDRLFRIVRARKDGPRLLELVTKRLEVAEDPDEIAKLFWERSRVLRNAGDREGALAALENVRMLEPDHVGALALSGEIYLTTQRFPEAAQHLGRLAELPAAPNQQRLMSGVAAVDIYENKLNDLRAALAVLVKLHAAGLSNLPVRERLARIAAKVEAWEDATSVLAELMHERDSSAGRIDAARLAMAIRRDRMNAPESAEAAVGKLLDEAPGDEEALDLVLSARYPESFWRKRLQAGLGAVVKVVTENPLEAERVDRLARIAERLGNVPLRQAALGALVSLGVDPAEIDPELRRIDERVARVPSIRIDDSSLPELFDPEDRGVLPDLFKELASTIAEALGPSLAALGVGKKERVDPRAGLPVRNEIAAWAGALGIGEFELYIGGRDPEGVYGVATEVPAIVVGSRVTAPLSPALRQAVARELLALRRGTTVLRHREPAEVGALVAAAGKVAGVEIPSPPFAMLGEFQRQLGKEMPRRVRKVLPELLGKLVASRHDSHAWYRAATSSLDRMAAVAAGDVSWVLCNGDVMSRGRLGASVEAQERARRLLSFVLSPTYLALREKLGMGVR